MSSTVLVLGGSGGIGRALCQQMARTRLRPIIGYRSNRDQAEALARETGGHALAIDLADDKSVERAVEEAHGLGELEGVILGASPPPLIGPFGRVTAEEMAAQWKINVAGPARLLQLIIRRQFQPRKRGTVVGILTAAMANGDRAAVKSMGGYVIAKYGQAGLLDVLAAEYPWLRVRSIRPGYTRTEMLRVFDERFLELYEKDHPILAPEEVASDILRLLDL